MAEFLVQLEANCAVRVEAETEEEAQELADEKAADETAYWEVIDVQSLEINEQ